MWLAEPTVTESDLARIQAPTLVFAGDQDPVSLEHTEAMAASIKEAQLRIVPGGENGLLGEQPVYDAAYRRVFARLAAVQVVVVCVVVVIVIVAVRVLEVRIAHRRGGYPHRGEHRQLPLRGLRGAVCAFGRDVHLVTTAHELEVLPTGSAVVLVNRHDSLLSAPSRYYPRSSGLVEIVLELL
jgi:hypothetical protein